MNTTDPWQRAADRISNQTANWISVWKEDHIDARERSFEEMKNYIKEKLQQQQLVMFKVEKFIRQAAESVGMQVYSDRILAWGSELKVKG